MRHEAVKQEVVDATDGQALFADGFEEALLGYVQIFNKTVALYDRDVCIAILSVREGMTEEEATEFFSYNVLGAYVGDMTPAFATITAFGP